MRNISKVTCLQQDSTDCGAACLLSVLRYYGGYDTLEHVRELCGSNSNDIMADRQISVEDGVVSSDVALGLC